MAGRAQGAEWNRLCLAYDPFEGGKGDCDARRFRDGFAIARKSGPCIICFEDIQPGQRVRVIAELFERKAHTFRCCPTCCDAMAAARFDEGRAIEERTRIGIDKSRAAA